MGTFRERLDAATTSAPQSQGLDVFKDRMSSVVEGLRNEFPRHQADLAAFEDAAMVLTEAGTKLFRDRDYVPPQPPAPEAVVEDNPASEETAPEQVTPPEQIAEATKTATDGETVRELETVTSEDVGKVDEVLGYETPPTVLEDQPVESPAAEATEAPAEPTAETLAESPAEEATTEEAPKAPSKKKLKIG